MHLPKSPSRSGNLEAQRLLKIVTCTTLSSHSTYPPQLSPSTYIVSTLIQFLWITLTSSLIGFLSYTLILSVLRMQNSCWAFQTKLLFLLELSSLLFTKNEEHIGKEKKDPLPIFYRFLKTWHCSFGHIHMSLQEMWYCGYRGNRYHFKSSKQCNYDKGESTGSHTVWYRHCCKQVRADLCQEN